MKNIKLDKDLIISILIAELVSIIVIMILRIFALMSWWLIYILLFSIFTLICYSIVKRYREDPNLINEFFIRLSDFTYEDNEDDNEEDNNITDEPYF